MKVTKLIREYVTDEITTIYEAKLNPYTEQAEIDRQKILSFKAELKASQQKAIDKFIDEIGLVDSSGNKRYKTEASVSSMVWAETKAMRNENLWKKDNRMQKEKAIKRILTALELGANRQELERIIAVEKELANENQTRMY